MLLSLGGLVFYFYGVAGVLEAVGLDSGERQKALNAEGAKVREGRHGFMC